MINYSEQVGLLLRHYGSSHALGLPLALSDLCQRAFATGLAKGDADRAALVEALTPFAGCVESGIVKSDRKSTLTDDEFRAAALALVRKGE